MANIQFKDGEGALMYRSATGTGSSIDPYVTVTSIVAPVKGTITTAHNGIAETATSVEIDCTGYNALIVHTVVTGAQNWFVKIQGAMTTGGVYADSWDGGNQMGGTVSTSSVVVSKGITDFIKIVATRTGGASTVVVKVQPINVGK